MHQLGSKLRQPRSGDRIQPTAQAVGAVRKIETSPVGAKETQTANENKRIPHMNLNIR